MALMGFMGAGKTTIGRHLATELAVPFVDTDDLIVARHGPVPEVFAREGEAGFRQRELDAVREALDGPPSVVALGGGAVTYEPTRTLLAERALLVYLDLPIEILLERLERSRTVRPLVGDKPSANRVRELLQAREPFYRQAEIIVPGPKRTKLEFARAIAELVRSSQNLS